MHEAFPRGPPQRSCWACTGRARAQQHITERCRSWCAALCLWSTGNYTVLCKRQASGISSASQTHVPATHPGQQCTWALRCNCSSTRVSLPTWSSRSASKTMAPERLTHETAARAAILVRHCECSASPPCPSDSPLAQLHAMSTWLAAGQWGVQECAGPETGTPSACPPLCFVLCALQWHHREPQGRAVLSSSSIPARSRGCSGACSRGCEVRVLLWGCEVRMHA